MKKLFLFSLFFTNILYSCRSDKEIAKLKSEIATMQSKLPMIDQRLNSFDTDIELIFEENQILKEIALLRKDKKYKEEKIDQLTKQISVLTSWNAISSELGITILKLKIILDNFIKNYDPNITSITIFHTVYHLSDASEKIRMLLKKCIMPEMIIDQKQFQQFVNELYLKTALLQDLENSCCVIL